MKLWLEKGGWASPRARAAIAERRPEDIRSIVIIRHAALGDQVLTRPFILEARQFFPNARITLSLIESYQYGAPVDLVDRVHVGSGRGDPRPPLREQIAKARALGPHDLLFDFAATTRSYWLTALTRAWLKIGFPYRHRLGRWLYDITLLRSDFRFEADVLLDGLNIIGCKTHYPTHYGYTEDPENRGRPYVVYFPGASVPTKQWPAELFVKLIAQLARAHPAMEHAILEGLGPLDAVAPIAEQLSDTKHVSVVKARPLPATISLLKGATLVISNDTGIRNLAIASEVPTLGIFFSTVVFRYWPRLPMHEVVFNADGSIPEVRVVREAAERALGRSTNDLAVGRER